MTLLPLCEYIKTVPSSKTTLGVLLPQSGSSDAEKATCLPQWLVPAHSRGHNLHINLIHQLQGLKHSILQSKKKQKKNKQKQKQTCLKSQSKQKTTYGRNAGITRLRI